MLGSLGFPCPLDGQRTSSSTKAAVTRFQESRAGALKVDGDAGTNTRKAVYRAYMDRLCDLGGGKQLELSPKQFLGGGADPGGKAAFQGCGEFNPVLMLAQAEQKELQKPDRKAERDRRNTPNRRVLVLLFPAGTVVSAAKWPCPRASEGSSGCKARFWSDAATRRQFQERERSFGKDRDTFACRFYHGLVMRSPCERLAGNQRIVVRLVDHLGRSFASRAATIWVNSDAIRTGTTDAEGNLALAMPDGEHFVEMDDGRFAHFGDRYQPYAHDEVLEIKNYVRPEFDRDAACKDGRGVETLEELSAALDVLAPDRPRTS